MARPGLEAAFRELAVAPHRTHEHAPHTQAPEEVGRERHPLVVVTFGQNANDRLSDISRSRPGRTQVTFATAHVEDTLSPRRHWPDRSGRPALGATTGCPPNCAYRYFIRGADGHGGR